MEGQQAETKILLDFIMKGGHDVGRLANDLREIEKRQRAIAGLQLQVRQHNLSQPNALNEQREKLRLSSAAVSVGQAEQRLMLQARLERAQGGGLLGDARRELRFRADQSRVARAEGHVGRLARGEELASGRFASQARREGLADAAERRLDREEQLVKLRIEADRMASGEAEKELRQEMALAREKERIGRAMQQAELKVLGKHHTDPRIAADIKAQQAFERRFETQLGQARQRYQQLASGGAGKEVAFQRELALIEERSAQVVRKAELQQTFGRRGGAMIHGLERFNASPLGMAATAGAVGIKGTALIGFAGTVEMHRLTMEFKLLARELAGSFKPVIELVTDGLRGMRRFLERIPPVAQDLIMYGTLAALALRGVAMAASLGRLGGLAGGLGFGGTAAASALGGAVAGRAGGAAAGAAAGKAAGAAGAGAAAATPWGMYVAGALATIVGVLPKSTRKDFFKDQIGLPDWASEYGSRITRSPVRLAVDNNPLLGFMQEKLRSDPTARAAAAFAGNVPRAMGLGGVIDAASGLFGDDRKRRSVVPADTGYEEVGSAFERIGSQLILMDKKGEEKAEEKKEQSSTDKLLEEIKKVLESWQDAVKGKASIYSDAVHMAVPLPSIVSQVYRSVK